MQSNNLSTLDEISIYRRNHTAACLLIDTNVFILFLVGMFDKDYLGKCSLMKENGKNYDRKHFELMEKILAIFLNKIVITPHILSEINMLSRKKIKPKELMIKLFQKIICQLEKCREERVEMKVILKNGGVVEFGFSDISLIEAATKNNWVILCDEFDLYRTYNEKIPILYFSKIVANEIQNI